MDTVKNNFGYTNGYFIKNSRIKSDLIKHLKEKYKIDPLLMYEKSYSDRLLDTILDGDSLVCPIYNGSRVLLYLTKIYNENISIIIYTSNNYIENGLPKMLIVPLSFDASLFNTTLFIGDIVNHKHNNKWVLYLERIFIYNGISSNTYSTLSNISLLNKLINQHYTPSFLDPFNIEIKKYTSLTYVEDAINKDKNTGIKGLRFYILKTPIAFYFNTNNYETLGDGTKLINDLSQTEIENIKKQLLDEFDASGNIIQKITVNDIPEINNIFTFLLKKSESFGLYDLYARNKYEMINIGIARIKKIEMNQELDTLFKTSNSCTVSCKYNYIFDKFEINELINNNNLSVSDYNLVIELVKKCKNLEKPNYSIED